MKTIMEKIKELFASQTAQNLKAAGKWFLRQNHLILFAVYLEVAFHLMQYGSYSGMHLLRALLMSVAIGLIATAISSVFTPLVNRICTFLFGGILMVYYMTQLVYFKVFRVYLSLYSVGAVGTDILQFRKEAWSGIVASAGKLLILAVPMFFMIIAAIFVTDFHKKSGKRFLYRISETVLCLFLFQTLIPVGGTDAFTAFDLYYTDWNTDLGIEKMGMLVGVQKDIKGILSKNSTNNENPQGELIIIKTPSPTPLPTPTKAVTPTPSVTQAPSPTPMLTTPSVTPTRTVTFTPTPTPTFTPTPIDTSPQVMDIDFLSLAAAEENSKIKNLHEYLAYEEPSNKNEYTGMFEGYNLIYITAEGWSPWAVDETITPTLYQMINSGFVFENFYNPIWYTSTSDGEFIGVMGIVPDILKSNSMKRTGTNALPVCLGNTFKRQGYLTMAFHNHTYDYYGRDITHPNMGYIYQGVGNGLNMSKRSSGKYYWPGSDLEMMELTVSQYAFQEPFHTYYMTVSGHLEYNFGGNNMAARHKDVVADLPYSDRARAYIACNYELELAMNYLIQELEADGVLDRTVIVINADHYPYGLEQEEINELAGHEVDTEFELYRNHLVIWNSKMEEPVIVDKYASTLDILPTILNLFGVEFDSRLYMGRDILSDSPALVMFKNKSFITDKVKYNSKTKEITLLTEETVSDLYISDLIQKVKNKFSASKNIIDYDYYSYLTDYFPYP